MSYFRLDEDQLNRITEKVLQFSDGSIAEETIHECLIGEGGELIKQSIQELLPVSGREWDGKKPAAKSAKPFRKDARGSKLSVTVRTVSNYNYLYFPDDGSNTIHHVGNQQFMFDGAEKVAEKIGDRIVEKLIERLER